MKKMTRTLAGMILMLTHLASQCQSSAPIMVKYDSITAGAERTDLYLPDILEKKVALVANHTSLVDSVHLVDTLLSLGVEIAGILSPEHGFRGNWSDGALISDTIDEKTGIPVHSLYGQNKKPSPEVLKDFDLVIYDIQDVGVRFYTYISTMTLVMEACAEQNIPFIVLDRPDPNGFYIDGPVLDTAFASFVGMHPVPVVYAMTPGEYAQMVNGEGWLRDGITCDLTVIGLKGYGHHMTFDLPVDPSPNLPNWESVYLYPSLAFFEGTVISVGRGTSVPFQVIGHPDYALGSFVFTPQSIPGKSKYPPHEGEPCYGMMLKGLADNYRENQEHLHLSLLLNMHDYFRGKIDFFNAYFDKLAGSEELRLMILDGKTEAEIRESWEPGLGMFQELRKKYLLYD